MKMEKKKIRISDFDGKKLDSAVIASQDDAKKVFKRWKLKGWL